MTNTPGTNTTHDERITRIREPMLTLDINSPSEFPSLSGAPSQHQQNPTQAAWGNGPTRAVSHTAVQRPQPSSQSGLIQSLPPQTQQPSQPSSSQPSLQQGDAFSASQFGSNLDELRFRGQDGVGQLGGSSQPKTGSIDEFPPLGRNTNGEIGRARDGSMMSAAGFGRPNPGNAFGAALGQLQSAQNRTKFPGSGGLDSQRPGGINGRVSSPMELGSGGMIVKSKRKKGSRLMRHSDLGDAITRRYDAARTGRSFQRGSKRKRCLGLETCLGRLILTQNRPTLDRCNRCSRCSPVIPCARYSRET